MCAPIWPLRCISRQSVYIKTRRFRGQSITNCAQFPIAHCRGTCDTKYKQTDRNCVLQHLKVFHHRHTTIRCQFYTPTNQLLIIGNSTQYCSTLSWIFFSNSQPPHIQRHNLPIKLEINTIKKICTKNGLIQTLLRIMITKNKISMQNVYYQYRI